MKHFKKILCPLDLSENSLNVLSLASSLAKQYDSELVFLYVSPQWLPEESLYGSEFLDKTISAEKHRFFEVRPTDDTVRFKHLFLHGNPGPEIVNASATCDLVVMSSHGHSGLLRFLMGSVAEYTVRHADCPVLTIKNPKAKSVTSETPKQKHVFVTHVMRHSRPIQAFNEMQKIVEELDQAKESAVPVVDEMGRCIGVLTKTDVEKYQDVKTRYESGDESVIDDVFETDKYGLRRTGSCDFEHVRRHMTSPVVTISNLESRDKAREIFVEHPDIHHLVVVNQLEQPIGIIKSQEILEKKKIPSKA